MARYRPGLTLTILAFLSLLLLLAWLLFSILAFKTAANDLYAQKSEHARTLLKAFVSLLPDSIPTYPEGFITPDSQVARYAQKLTEESAFNRMTLLDMNGKPIFSAGRDESDIYSPFIGLPQIAEGSFIKPDGSSVIHIITVNRDGAAVGKAGLLLSLAPEKARLNRSRQMLIAYFVLDFILLLGLGSFVLSRIVIKPINRLLTATEKITGGQYSQRLNISGSAELARLAVAFNEMAGTLNSREIQAEEQMAALTSANRELEQAREEALRTEKMASIGLLAAGMAHEIGTPLAAIMGYAELVAGEYPEKADLQDYAGRISEDCLRIDRIVRGLLDFARPRAVSAESTDVRSVILSTVELLNHQGIFKNINVSLEVEDPLLPAKCDQYQLQQVIINLLLNGRDATPDGGGISVSAKLEDEFICIDVSDTGSGIPEESLKLIFDPFFTTKPPGKGTGLGLAISARIIEGFGGRIKAVSRVGEGSCFTVCIPLATGGGVV
ncbi:MAG: HAMP domain-containing sensor histidine kinase [Desulfuromonadaceae bacterium]|nr:HAMP domain-containing sensor histidine kinase [Desulfuromonadaceae bacterium]MDD2855455.1 HAMP domain-containing sensor histidine kinase [Desulfuromonadaceae bacterium]